VKSSPLFVDQGIQQMILHQSVIFDGFSFDKLLSMLLNQKRIYSLYHLIQNVNISKKPVSVCKQRTAQVSAEKTDLHT